MVYLIRETNFTYQYVVFSSIGKNIYENIETYIYAHLRKRERKWEMDREHITLATLDH